VKATLMLIIDIQ